MSQLVKNLVIDLEQKNYPSMKITNNFYYDNVPTILSSESGLCLSANYKVCDDLLCLA